MKKVAGIWLKLKSILSAIITNLSRRTNIIKSLPDKSINSRNQITKVQFFQTLRFKLIASFFIPVIFIITLGVVSYQVASNGIKGNYESATLSSIDMASELIHFGLNNVSATSTQYITDNSIVSYLRNNGDDLTLSTTRKTITNAIVAKSLSDAFISDIHMISKDSLPISTKTKLDVDDDFLDKFKETEVGKYLNANRTQVAWDGHDEYIDKALGVDSGDYSLRLFRYFPGMDALLIIEIKPNTINNIMANLSLDTNSVFALVAPDQVEIIDRSRVKGGITYKNMEDPILTGEEFYQKASNNAVTSGSEYVTYGGKSYLFMYSKIGSTGAMLTALEPEAAIQRQVKGIAITTFLIVTIALIVAIVTVAVLSTSIDRTIRGINTNLRKAATGDLTVQFNSKRKDEFKILIDEIQTTFNNMKELIQQVKTMSNDVSLSASNVSNSSTLFLSSTKEISTAMTEIEQGINQQAKDAEECLIQMDHLSKGIELVSTDTKEISLIADDTKKRVLNGTIITQELNDQTSSTIAITTDIIDSIASLADKSNSIRDIINVINEIAEQTNLLSLNASIEAARAGEQGRGFAVVANEIRKLAEQSASSVNDIRSIIDSILDDTSQAVETAKKATGVLQLQENAVVNTTSSYQFIHEGVEKLLMFLKSISKNVETIEESRSSTLASIENISAVLEEIAASTNNVNEYSLNQLNNVGTLNESAETLKNTSSDLVQEVQKFTI